MGHANSSHVKVLTSFFSAFRVDRESALWRYGGESAPIAGSYSARCSCPAPFYCRVMFDVTFAFYEQNVKVGGFPPTRSTTQFSSRTQERHQKVPLSIVGRCFD